MANPNKAAGYKRKMARIAEECRPTRELAEAVKADWDREYRNTLRTVTVKITMFKVGPRPYTRKGVTKQAYNFMIRAYEKSTPQTVTIEINPTPANVVKMAWKDEGDAGPLWYVTADGTYVNFKDTDTPRISGKGFTPDWFTYRDAERIARAASLPLEYM